MNHLSAFYIEDVETKDRFGTIEIAKIAGYENSYAYFYRSLDGKYTELYRLKSLSVQECRKFEETKLRDIVNDYVATLKIKDWNIYRTRPTIWDDGSKMSPEITNSLYLECKQYLFENDSEDDA